MNLNARIIAIAISTCLVPMAFGAEKERHDGRLKVGQLPVPVQTTLQSEGGKVQKVEKETEGGQSFYEATLSREGQRYSLHIAPDGTVIKREAPEDHDKKTR